MSRMLPSTYLVGLCPATLAYGPLMPDLVPFELEQCLGDGIALARPGRFAEGDTWRLSVRGSGCSSSTLAAGQDDRGYRLWHFRTSDEPAPQPATVWPAEEPKYGDSEPEVVLIGGGATCAHPWRSTALAVRFSGEPGLMELHAYASDRWPGPTTASARPPHSAPWSTVDDTSRVQEADRAEPTPEECPNLGEPDDDEPPYIFGDVVLGAWGRE